MLVAASALSCGRDLSPDAGAGGAAGGGGETDGSDCRSLEVNRFAVCWDRDLGPPSGERVVNDLSFVRAVEPDGSYCVQGFPYFPSANFTSATAPFLAWELEDASGDPFIVQFAIEGATPDVLQRGDIVDFNARTINETDRGALGAVWLERSGAPVIGFFLHSLPTFEAVPDFGIETDHAMCADEEGTYCHVARAIRVTANGEADVVPVAESKVVGGLAVFNAYYFDNRDCEQLQPGNYNYHAPSSELGVYAVREPEQ
jgi:hypothetical protein